MFPAVHFAEAAARVFGLRPPATRHRLFLRCLEQGGVFVTLVLLGASIAFGAGTRGTASSTASTQDAIDAEQPFLAENEAAMARMMAAMTVAPTGDVNRDFVAMMVPHHQGAIEMALAMLRHGSNEQLRRLAQEIIVTQQQEIAAMRLAVGDPPSRSQPASSAEDSPPTPGATLLHRSMVMP